MNFKEITYTEPDFNALKKEFETLLKTFENENALSEVLAIFKKLNQLKVDFITAWHLASILNMRDNSIEIYQEADRFFQQHLPLFGQLTNRFYKALLEHPQRKALEATLGKQLFFIAANRVTDKNVELTALSQEENKLKYEYRQALTQKKSLPYYEGKEIGVGQLFGYLRAEDRETRQKAWAAWDDYQYKTAPALEALFEQLVQIRHRRAVIEGYQNFTHLGYVEMERQNYGVEEVEHFSRLIQKYIVPLRAKMHRKKEQRLNIGKLQPYDRLFHFPDGNPKLKGTFAELTPQFQQMFSSISPELGELFRNMSENGFIDAEFRKNKTPIAMKITLPNYNMSYVFSHPLRRAKDIAVLAHEMGHAFQAHKSVPYHEKVYEYLYPSMELAEVHSTTLEFLTLPYYKVFFKEDTPKAYTLFMEHIIDELLLRTAREEFQRKVYDNPHSGIDTRNDYWRAIRQKYFPSLDKETNPEHPYYTEGKSWQKSMHIFMRPFYMIDYALAYTCALQFWMRAEKDRDLIWQDYVAICERGGSISFFEALDIAHLDSPFEEDCIKRTAVYLEAWIDGHIC